jgi:hypothetical protein
VTVCQGGIARGLLLVLEAASPWGRVPATPVR